MSKDEEQRELTTSEQLIILVVASVAGFLAKKIVGDAIESEFRHRKP